MNYKPNIISGGSQMFEDILYGPPDLQLSRYINDSMKAMSGYITDKTSTFFSKARSVYEQFTGEAARQRIYNNILSNNVHFTENMLSLVTEDNYTNISNMNRRFLMVCPEIFTNKQKEIMSGFSGAYEDRDPYVTDVYFKRDYMEAVRGIINFDDGEMKYITTLENDSNLTFAEQIIIKKNWQVGLKMLAEDIDVTESMMG